MNLGEAKNKALSLMAEYSVDGVVIPDGENADYLDRMNRFADIAQKEIATIKKIHAVYSISQNPIKSLLGLLKGFDLQQHLDVDLVDTQGTGAQSYYFEVDRTATVYIEECVNGVWNILQTLTIPTITEFTAYKGFITPTSLTNLIRLRFSGAYPYNIRNRALYAYKFPTVQDIPDYTPFTKYEMPTDFMEVQKVVQQTDPRTYMEMISCKWEGKKTLVLNYYDTGSFDIHYYRYPTTIDSNTPDSYEFEVYTEAQDAIPFFLAAKCLMDENILMSMQLSNEFNTKLNGISTKDKQTASTVSEVYGW